MKLRGLRFEDLRREANGDTYPLGRPEKTRLRASWRHVCRAFHTESATTRMANGDLFMLCLIYQAAAELVIGHLKDCLRHPIRFLRHDGSQTPLLHNHRACLRIRATNSGAILL